MTKDPRPTPQSMGTVWYRQALQKTSQTLIEHLSPTAIRVTLLQKGVITAKEREKLQRENVNHGDMAETEKLLDFLLNKEEGKLKDFVYVLTSHSKPSYRELGQMIDETQSQMSRGLDTGANSELQGIVYRLKQKYREDKFRVEYPVPNDDSLTFDVADKSRNLLYQCEARMINQARLDQLKAKTHPKYINAEYDQLTVERIEEVLYPLDRLKTMKKIDPPRLHKRHSSFALPTNFHGNLVNFRRVKSDVNLNSPQQEDGISSDDKHAVGASSNTLNVPKSNEDDFSGQMPLDSDMTLVVPKLQVETADNDHVPDTCFDESSRAPKTRLHVCAGDAGMGKTTLLKRLAYKWALKESKPMLHFTAVFVFPLRSVNFELTIEDLIAHIGLLSKDDAEYLIPCMNYPMFAEKVLFMLDGCDEVKIPPESAIGQLIEGTLFPGTNVLVTVRPDTSTYQKLCQFHPFAMVKMVGTEPDSIRHYLQTNLQLSRDDVDNLLEKNFFDFDILSKPLYLTMFCAMYDKDIPIKIPDSNTDLFNGFMSMLVKREIERFEIIKTSNIKHGSVRPQSTTLCKRSPLEPESTIPTDVKHNIYFIGKMAYEGLLQNRQTFTENDLKEYMLNDQILICTGLFCFGKDDEKRQTSFFRHKLMQEYMAALYIAKEGFKIQSLSEMVEVATRSQKPSLQTIFAQVQQPILMACGLSSSFYKDVLRRVKPYTSITKDKFQECNIHAQFEFSLCFEAGCRNEEIAREMEDYMLQVPINETVIGGHAPCSSYHKKCISVVTHCFSQETCKKLLKKWFDISANINTDCQARILASTTTADPYSPSTDHVASSFEISNGIGLVWMSMLSRFHYPDVTTLSIKGQRGVVDIQRFCVIFPRLRIVDVLVNFPIDLPQDSDVKKKLDNGEYCKSIKKFTQKGRTHMKWPMPSVKCLMSQTGLEFLSLYGVDILSNMPEHEPCRWSNMSTLKMTWCDITKTSTQKVVHILKSTPNLTLLDLSENQSLHIDALSIAVREMNHLSTLNLKNIGLTHETTNKLFALFKNAKNIRHLNMSDNNGLNIHILCQAIEKHLTNLETLKLFRSLDYEGSLGLAEYLPRQENLRQLGVYSNDIQNAEDKLIESLPQNMKELEIQVEEVQFETALSVQQKQKLQKRGIQVYELATEL